MGNSVSWDTGYRAAIGCVDCGEVIFSRYSGEFVGCGCGKLFVDQTKEYCRVLGGKYEYLGPINIKTLDYL